MKAKLSTSDPKDWFVFWRTESGRLMKKRGGINRVKSLRERKKLAQEVCDIINKELQTKVSAIDPPALTVLRGIVDSKRSSLRHRSWQSYHYAINALEKWLPDPDIKMHEITKQDARSFLDHLVSTGNKGKSINGIRGFLTAIFNYYCDRNEGYTNPFRGTQKQKQDVGKNLAFSEAQKVELLDAMPTELQLFTRFMYYTYIRPLELLRLRVGDIRGDMIIIQGDSSKNSKQQSVVIPDAFLEEVRRIKYDTLPGDWYLFGRGLVPGAVPYGRNSVSKLHRTVLDNLGYSKDYTLYSWKHTGVVAAYRAGIDIYSIMRQLRHHSLDMTQIYLKSLGLVRNEEFGRLMR